jgi:quinohemoprotein ethanol dehydrogenase
MDRAAAMAALGIVDPLITVLAPQCSTCAAINQLEEKLTMPYSEGLLLFASALGSLLVSAAVAEPSTSSSDGSTARYLDNSDGRDWPGYGRTFGEQHYSPLTQIDQTNIRRLSLAWSIDLGPESSWTQPIAVDGVLYLATGYSIVHAVDAASGKLLWRYDPKAAEKAGINLRFGWGSRGIAWWNGKIYTGTQDGRLIAIDARTGTPVWSAQTIDKDTAAYISGAPRVFDGKVIIGYASDTGKNRGYVTTYDAETGLKLWRFYTVPGNPANGFENKAMEMAAKTWAGEWWKFGGGGAVWNAMAYDAGTDTVYIGVGGGYPGNRRARSEDQGDNLFLASIVALDGKTGAYKWHYQEVPGDTWDYDATMDIELADLIIAGKPRQVLMQAPKNGFYYVIDRITGKVISSEPYTKVNWASRIDLKTGRPVENAGVRYANGATALIWPGFGAHGWYPMAYSPKMRLAYLPVWESGMTFSDKGIDLKPWRAPTDRTVDGVHGYRAADYRAPGGPLPFNFLVVAWNPLTQKVVWKRSSPVFHGGIMVTAGDLVFQGAADGTFQAYAAATGKLLWSFAAQASAIAPPISYAVNGKQYVTVLASPGSAGAAGAMIKKQVIDLSRQARRVLTFALDGKAILPAAGAVDLPMVEDPEFKPDAGHAEAGQTVYEEHCLTCHGASGVSRTPAPDLRRSAIPLSAEAFAGIVRDGAFVPRGMPAFGEFTNEQLGNLRQYIRSEAEKVRQETSSK